MFWVAWLLDVCSSPWFVASSTLVRRLLCGRACAGRLGAVPRLDEPSDSAFVVVVAAVLGEA